MQTKLILIRHGETDWNAEKRYMGSTDIELNERGLSQARSLREKLSGLTIDAVYSSDLRRAARFAGELFAGRAIETMPELREMRFGLFEGMRYDDLVEKYPELYHAWADNPFGVDIPGGESAGGFRERIGKAFRGIAARNADKTSAIVTHGGPIGMFLADVLALEDIWSAMPGTGDMRAIECGKDGIWARSRLF